MCRQALYGKSISTYKRKHFSSWSKLRTISILSGKIEVGNFQWLNLSCKVEWLKFGRLDIVFDLKVSPSTFVNT